MYRICQIAKLAQRPAVDRLGEREPLVVVPAVVDYVAVEIARALEQVVAESDSRVVYETAALSRSVGLGGIRSELIKLQKLSAVLVSGKIRKSSVDVRLIGSSFEFVTASELCETMTSRPSASASSA